MENGLYSLSHAYARRCERGRDSGILILRDGSSFLGGGPCFWSTGFYTCGNGTWKGRVAHQLQHTPLSDPALRSHTLFGGQEVTSGFSGTFDGDQAEAFGTSLVGTRSLSFRATLKRLADN